MRDHQPFYATLRRLGTAVLCLGLWAGHAAAQTAPSVHHRLPNDPVVDLRPTGPTLREERAEPGAAPHTVTPSQQFSHGDPTAAEQLMLEMINRARANPPAEGVRLATTTNTDVLGAYNTYNVETNQLISDFAGYSVRHPLAFCSNLIASARRHSNDMALNDFQDHTGSDRSTMTIRIVAAGYTNWNALGENIYAYTKSVFYGHAGFNVDWGVSSLGHRQNIMNYTGTVYNEIGIGIVTETNNNTSVGPLVVTQDFGKRSSYKYILGVVYSDTDRDGFYSEGEGLAGVTVLPASGTYYAVTSTSGGYAIPYSSLTGALTVTFSSGGLTTTAVVNVSTQNVKLDIVLSTNAATTNATATVSPDIAANGSDGPVTLTATNTLSVSAALPNGSASGANADWWIAADTPMGFYWLTSAGWTTNSLPAYQGPLVNISPTVILSMPAGDLPTGAYTFYFAVDGALNGQLDWSTLVYDAVAVTLQP